MNIFDIIASRRSIRTFSDESITETQIKTLLTAGMNAPSAMNTQPWHMMVIQNRETLNKLADICPNAQMLRHAPAAIMVMGDLNDSKDYFVIDCSAAVQNILLAARGEGLGSCWLGVYPRQPRVDGISEMFSLPKNIVPHSLIALGYPAETKGPNNNYRKERIHNEKW